MNSKHDMLAYLGIYKGLLFNQIAPTPRVQLIGAADVGQMVGVKWHSANTLYLGVLSYDAKVWGPFLE